MLALQLAGPTPTAASPIAAVPHVAGAGDWTVYHGNAQGSGNDPSGTTFSPASQAWKSPALDGQLYGEPLEATGRVFAATENDTVYALSAQTGQVLWSTHVGTPVPASALPCGDITPNVGITGTPVVDPSRSEIFAVADEFVNGAPSHHLVGLNLYSGAVMLDEIVDPQGAQPAAILQRTGLNLDAGQVIFGFGGNDNDCSTYHGWILAMPEGGGSGRAFEIDGGAGQSQGAIWMGGAAPEVDAAGSIWAAAGNGSNTKSTDPYDGSDSVFALSPALALEQYFAPSQWYSDNGSDADLGSTAPALVGNGTVLQVGKSKTAYLLSQAALGGIGGQRTSLTACNGSDADGGDAVSGAIVYVPCRSGIEAVQTNASPPSLSIQWTAASHASDPPIVAGGLVWAIGASTLYGINPANGATVQQFALGGEANHFPTPSVGDGLLLAPSTNQVVAFSGSAGLPGPPSLPPPNSSYWLVAADGGIFTYGDAPYLGSTGALSLNKPIVGMAATRDGHGYWLVASDGGIFSFGDAPYLGSTGALPLNRPIVGMAVTPDGKGYWLVASDGGVFAFGDALFWGSTGAIRLNKPMVGMAPSVDGRGYWLVASDGGIFTFGDAVYQGSTGALALNKPVVGLGATADGRGYWLVASDGGIFAFGDAPFFGSTGALRLNKPIVGLAPTADAGGYWLVASDGGIFTFGDAAFLGSAGATALNKPVVGMAATVG
jgi:outer membrane protein assembly factor BamB